MERGSALCGFAGGVEGSSEIAGGVLTCCCAGGRRPDLGAASCKRGTRAGSAHGQGGSAAAGVAECCWWLSCWICWLYTVGEKGDRPDEGAAGVDPAMAGRCEEMAICAAVGVKRRRGARAAGSEVRHGDGAADQGRRRPDQRGGLRWKGRLHLGEDGDMAADLEEGRVD